MKKIIAFILISAIALCLVSCGVQSGDIGAVFDVSADDLDISAGPQQNEWREPTGNYAQPASGFAGGSGTEEDPYRISSYEMLVLFSEKVSTDESFRDAYYSITADISAKGGFDFQAVSEFGGVLDGGGHTVSGLNIIERYYPGDYKGIGFICTLKGTVRKLRVTDMTISCSGMKDSFGGIAGYSVGKITASSADVSFKLEKCEGMAGPIAGAVGGGNIEECTNSCSVSCADGIAAGGIIGGISLESPDHDDIWIRHCSNSGSVHAPLAGGIAGIIRADSGTGFVRISSCTVSSGAVVSSSTGETAGGIVGSIEADDSAMACEIRRNDNYSEVRSSKCAGGVLGSCRYRNDRGSSLDISVCSHSGKVHITSTDGYSAAGGIVGIEDAPWLRCIVLNCRTYGSVVVDSCPGGSGRRMVGGVTGRVGDPLADDNDGDQAFVNVQKSRTKFWGAMYTGTINVPAESNFKTETAAILGSCAGTEEYAFQFVDCYYWGYALGSAIYESGL